VPRANVTAALHGGRCAAPLCRTVGIEVGGSADRPDLRRRDLPRAKGRGTRRLGRRRWTRTSLRCGAIPQSGPPEAGENDSAARAKGRAGAGAARAVRQPRLQERVRAVEQQHSGHYRARDNPHPEWSHPPPPPLRLSAALGCHHPRAPAARGRSRHRSAVRRPGSPPPCAPAGGVHVSNAAQLAGYGPVGVKPEDRVVSNYIRRARRARRWTRGSAGCYTSPGDCPFRARRSTTEWATTEWGDLQAALGR